MDIVETYDMAKGGLPRFALFKEGIFEVRTPRHIPPSTFSPRHFLNSSCAKAFCGRRNFLPAPEFVKLNPECSKGGVVVVQEEYPALKSKAARSAQGFYDYMNKLEQEMNEVRMRSGDPGIQRISRDLRAILIGQLWLDFPPLNSEERLDLRFRSSDIGKSRRISCQFRG